ncbi:hypothetical protein KC219_21810, partial [Mycobacterium tuberculosis]|nr:hypothetical protein [Mycobacterium tuberculosis]
MIVAVDAAVDDAAFEEEEDVLCERPRIGAVAEDVRAQSFDRTLVGADDAVRRMIGRKLGGGVDEGAADEPRSAASTSAAAASRAESSTWTPA